MTGSVLTPDFQPGISDINSIVVVENVSLDFLDFIVRLGKKYSRYNIGAPMLMTPKYIKTSLDVFPIEFLNFSAIHHTISGPDILKDLKIDRDHLRLQCEREMKSKQFWLHQGYIEALDDRQLLGRRLSSSITSFIPLFRAILFLGGHEFFLSAHETADAVEKKIGLKSDIFNRMLAIKEGGRDSDTFCDCFADYYQATRQLSDYVEALS